MGAIALAPGWIIVPILTAFVINALAEWALLTSENRILITLSKSAKATIVPALIALYALIIANIIVSSNG